jgi:hypothetical protein
MTEPERATRKRRATRWTAERARSVLPGWRASGKSAAAFAGEQGITATRASRAAIEIDMPGLTLRVHDNADAGYVAQLVAALRAQGVP